ncbi:four helix bundle protein [Aquimarina sp. M1]
MKKENIVQTKSYDFALSCIKLFKKLTKEQHEYILSKQVLRSGTSIGANIEEAIGGQSTRDFLSKMSISYKEARETHYWLRLLRDSNYISRKESKSLIEQCEELLRIIGSIQKTTKLKTRN